MCLPVSRLFWVSSLAYPNLLGTKGYVVVVVVVCRCDPFQKKLPCVLATCVYRCDPFKKLPGMLACVMYCIPINK
jgi:hypothetical protein